MEQSYPVFKMKYNGYCYRCGAMIPVGELGAFMRPGIILGVKCRTLHDPRWNYPLEQRDWAKKALAFVGTACDGARALDFVGFSKANRNYRWYHQIKCYTDLQMREAIRLITKYRRQIPEALVVAAGGTMNPDRKPRQISLKLTA